MEPLKTEFMLGLMGSLGEKRSVFIFKIGFLCPFWILLLLFSFLHENGRTVDESRDLRTGGEQASRSPSSSVMVMMRHLFLDY